MSCTRKIFCECIVFARGWIRMVGYARLSELSIDVKQNLVDSKMRLPYTDLFTKYRHYRLWLGSDLLPEPNWSIERRSEFVVSLFSDREEDTDQLLFVIEIETDLDENGYEQDGGWELVYGIQPFLTIAAFYDYVHESYISENKETLQNRFSLTGLTGDFKKYNNLRYGDLSDELRNKLVVSHCTVFLNRAEGRESRYQRRKKTILQALQSHI